MSSNNNNKNNKNDQDDSSFLSILTQEKQAIPSLLQTENDEEFKRLKGLLTECTDKSSTTGVVRALGASAAAVPFCIFTGSFMPLLFFSFGAIGYDMYASFSDCKKQRDAVDLHLLKKHKMSLFREKQMLETRKSLLLGGGSSNDNNEPGSFVGDQSL